MLMCMIMCHTPRAPGGQCPPRRLSHITPRSPDHEPGDPCPGQALGHGGTATTANVHATTGKQPPGPCQWQGHSHQATTARTMPMTMATITAQSPSHNRQVDRANDNDNHASFLSSSPSQPSHGAQPPIGIASLILGVVL